MIRQLIPLLVVIFLETACSPTAEQNDENQEQIMEGEDPVLEEETQDEDSLRNRDMMVILPTTGSLEQTIR